MPKPQQREPERVLGEAHARGLLEEVAGVCEQMAADASRNGKPDAAIALAQLKLHIRTMQARESVRELDGGHPLDPPSAA
jgi:hypothetical protein